MSQTIYGHFGSHGVSQIDRVLLFHSCTFAMPTSCSSTLEAPSFLIEKLPHIRRVHVSHWVDSGSEASVLECARNDVMIHRRGHASFRVLLDCHIDHEKCHRVQNKEYTTCTLPLTLDLTRENDLDLPSANELKSNRNLHCRKCRCELVNISGANRVLPMPSEHWMELSELWICDPHTLKQMDKPYGLPQQPLDSSAIVDTVLVGASYLIVPKSFTKRVSLARIQ
jgi:hypothetical protein